MVEAMHRGMERWAQRADAARLPVGRVVREALRAMEAGGLADADPDEIAEVVGRDPALTLHLLSSANSVEHLHLDNEVGTIRHAALMLGTARIFPMAQALPVDEEALTGEALAGYRRAAARARRAGVLARDWAGWRGDQLPDEVYAAALAAFAGELAAWAWEPEGMVQVEAMMADGIASEDAEYLALGCALVRLSSLLAYLWSLPPLALQALEPANALQPRPYGVMLAVELARALERGWGSRAARQALAEAAAWIELPVAELEARAQETLAEAGLAVPEAAEPRGPAVPYLLAPRPDLFRQALAALGEAGATPLDAAVELALDALHDGLGLNRVVFARLVRHGEALRAHRFRGTEHSPAFNRFELPLWGGHLFSRLVEEGGCLRVCKEDAERWSEVPEAVRELVQVPVFLAAAVRGRGGTVGLLYADRRFPEAPIRDVDLERFAEVVTALEAALAR